MNAIYTAIHRISSIHIPEEILRYGLVEGNTNDNKLSTDELMLRKIIRPIVMGDMNLYGANEILIPINRCQLIYSGADGFSVLVPKSLTNDREIVTVGSIIVGDPYGTGTGINSSAQCDMSTMVENNLAPTGNISSADGRLIGSNTVYINKYFQNLDNLVMTCIIDNDAALNNLSTRSYDKFTELTLYATQAYIFNHKRLSLGKGHIEYGHSIDTYKEIIYEWSDASKTYREFFDDIWRKVSFMNDKTRRKKLVNSMFSNNM